MGIRRQLKPAFPLLNTEHPLAYKLTHFWTMHEGNGLLLRNIGSYGAQNDILIDSATDQSWTKDDTTSGSMVVSANASSGNNRGQPRTALPDYGGLWSMQCRISPRGTTDSWGRIIGNGTGSGMWVRGSGSGGTNGKFSMETNLGNTASTATMDNTTTNRTWYDWIVTHNQGTTVGTIYLNGVQDNTYGAGGMGVWQPNSLFNDSSSETLVALVEFIRIWKDRALTAGEALQAATDPYAVLRPNRRWYLFGLAFPSVTYTPTASALKFASVAPSITIQLTLTPAHARVILSASPPSIAMSGGAISPAEARLRFTTAAPTVHAGPVITPPAATVGFTARGATFLYGSTTITPAAAVARLAARGGSVTDVFPLNFGSSADWSYTYQSATWPVEQSLAVLNAIADYGDGVERRVSFNLAYNRADGEAGVTRYSGRNTFKLKLSVMNFDRAAKVLWQFYKRMGGSLRSFYVYNVPDEIAGADPSGQNPQGRYRVRFADNSLTREKFALLLYRAEITLLEVRD